MPAEVDFPLKRAHASIATVGLVSGMFPSVSDQIRRLTKGFATDGALVRLLASVNIGMLLHIRLLMEALVAIGTGIGPRVGVDQQVGAERRGALECLSALLA